MPATLRMPLKPVEQDAAKPVPTRRVAKATPTEPPATVAAEVACPGAKPIPGVEVFQLCDRRAPALEAAAIAEAA